MIHSLADGYVLAWDYLAGKMKWINIATQFAKTAVDSAATPDYIGETANDGVVQADSTISYVDNGDWVTLGIADDGVSTIKIQDAAVTTEKLANASVSTDKIQDNAVNSAKIEDNSILSDDIKNGEVKTIDLMDLGVTTAKLTNSAVTTTKIKSDAVTKEKVAADVAGNGLAQNADGSLEANTDNSNLEVNA